VNIKDAMSGAWVKSVFFPAEYVPQLVNILPDVNGNGADEVGVLGVDASGAVVVNIKDAVSGAWVKSVFFPSVMPGSPPPPPATGQSLYDSKCAGCHAVNGYDATGSPDLAGKGSLIATRLATAHNGQTLDATQRTLVANFLNQYTSPPPATGQSLYDSKCAGCHSVNGYDATGSPDLAGKGSLIATRLATAHNGQTLDATQRTLVATFLDQYTPPAGGGGSCTSCHAQPPTGSAAPNRAGAHAVHTALPEIGTDCAACHAGSLHNGQIDIVMTPLFNAESGFAVGNTNQTCSNVSCHGGQTTPNWLTGTINVNTQCTSCHASGTAQYNSYNSGKHTKHIVDKKVACVSCHSTTKLATNHFTSLETAAMEGPASATIGGTGTSVSAYNTSTRNCTTSCHGNKSW
jgi:predicted CxxxxCH...CXXCH cytochrome family protein